MAMEFVYQTDLMTYEACYEANEQKSIPNSEMQSNLSSLLLDLVDEGDNILETIEELKPFVSGKIPKISLYDYLGRILKQAQCSQECLIIGLVYMDRLSQRWGRIVVQSVNVHRLYVTCVMVAAKFFDDRFFQNQYYAKVAGISKDEFNFLERTLVFLMDFRLLIDPTIFFRYRQRILLAYGEEL